MALAADQGEVVSGGTENFEPTFCAAVSTSSSEIQR